MPTLVTYDELTGPDLDPARWTPARLPLPSGDTHLAHDPGAELVVGDGEVRVSIPRFTLADDAFQAADSAKYLVISTDDFAVPADRPVTFAVEQAVENIGGDPADYRRGMAAFHVFDLKVTTLVFSAIGTSTRAFALHEQLAGFGIWTMLPIRDGRSQSLDGQGLNARWRGFREVVA